MIALPRVLVMLAIVWASARPAAAQEPASDRRPLVSALRIEGVLSVMKDELVHGLATRPTRCRTILYAPLCLFSKSPLFTERAYLDPDELRRDVIRIRLFYWRRGFRDADVTVRTAWNCGTTPGRSARPSSKPGCRCKRASR
jgi:hypothetical protein